jgi:cell fate regulator YaaT (PSP1 superfamily)
VGRFTSIDGTRYARGERAVCRTNRGLEVGEILRAADSERGAVDADGDLIRKFSIQDNLLLERIERRKDEAFRACADLIEERGLTAILLDVELLFDGQSLYFHFLGEVDHRVEALTSELTEAYDAQVRFRSFTESLIDGCGPDCGTENAAGGCGSSGCGSCAVASACGSRNAS